MIYYFKPSKQGDLLLINWEAPTKLEKELEKGLGKAWWADIGRETGVRTLPQNASIHLYLTQLAETLNLAGLTMRQVLEKRPEISWTPSNAKETLWRPIQKALTGKESSTQLGKTGEIDGIVDHLNLFLSQEFGVECPTFPSEETKPLAKV